ncbi:MAG TPA: MFS transporter [Candidatus Binatia bacterium]|nr:MFS transporter [Candidatus Binatia bacterium]
MSAPVSQAEPRIPRRRSRIGAAFGYRDFRLLWFGLLVSNLGTWMQFTTLGYFVAYLAGSPSRAALYVGFLGASRALPVLLFSPLAGVIADHYPRRRIILTTSSIVSGLSLLLATLTLTHHINIAEIFLLSGCLAAAQCFDAPARQSWIPFIVSREHVANAVGLNQIAFNSPSIIGPPIAGVLIASVGIAASFYVNAVTVLAVTTVVFLMQSPPVMDRSAREPILRAIGSGLRFIALHPVLRWIVFILFANALLLRPYNFLLPAYALHVVNTGPKGLGWLMASAGIGGVSGAILTAVFTTGRRARRWFIASAILACCIVLLGLNHSFIVALVILFVLGIGSLTFTGLTNILIQTTVPDDMRGRTMSIYSMIMQGMVPAGTLLLGSIASLTNLSVTLTGAGIVGLTIALWVWLANPALRDG